MFYKINNKSVENVLEDFHFIVMYSLPVKSEQGWYFPWQIWTNDNWIQKKVSDFVMSMTAHNYHNTSEIDWKFFTRRETPKIMNYYEFMCWAYDKYVSEGWSYGIVDSFDDREIQSSIVERMNRKKYDYTPYIGACNLEFFTP